MRGRRRAIQLHRTRWGTARWFLTSRLTIAVVALSALVILVAVLMLARPWQGLIDERVVYVPVPATTCPGEESR